MPPKGRTIRAITNVSRRQEIIRTTSITGSSTLLPTQTPVLPPIPVLPNPLVPTLPAPVPEVVSGVPWIRSIRTPSLRPGYGPQLPEGHLRKIGVQSHYS